MVRAQTDLPFKASETTIVIVKALPILQCERCAEYSLEGQVMEWVDEILRQIDIGAESEVAGFAT